MSAEAGFCDAREQKTGKPMPHKTFLRSSKQFRLPRKCQFFCSRFRRLLPFLSAAIPRECARCKGGTGVGDDVLPLIIWRGYLVRNYPGGLAADVLPRIIWRGYLVRNYSGGSATDVLPRVVWRGYLVGITPGGSVADVLPRTIWRGYLVWNYPGGSATDVLPQTI